MSNFDRNTSFGYGRGVARPTTAEIDQGLRAYMLGVYNYMTLGLGVTGLVALGTYMLAVAKTAPGALALTPFGQMLYTTPLRWVVICRRSRSSSSSAPAPTRFRRRRPAISSSPLRR